MLARLPFLLPIRGLSAVNITERSHICAKNENPINRSGCKILIEGMAFLLHNCFKFIHFVATGV